MENLFDDGNLKSEGIFEYTVEDHIGTTNFCKSLKTYHPNGNLSGEGPLRGGLKSGEWLCLKENARIKPKKVEDMKTV